MSLHLFVPKAENENSGGAGSIRDTYRSFSRHVLAFLAGVFVLFAVPQKANAAEATSLLRTDANPTSATVLGFLLTFSEPVSGVTSTSLAVSGSGVSATLAEPAAEGDGTTWTVSTSAVTGDGTLGVDFVNPGGTADGANNPVTNTLVGEQYNVDQTAPTVDAIVRIDTNPTSATTLTFNVTFSEAVSGLTEANLAVSGTGVTATIGAPATADGVNWTVEISSVSGSGTIGLDLVNGSGVVDAAGNPPANTLAGEQYDVDQTAPTAISLVRTDANPTSATKLGFLLTFSEPVSGVTSTSLALSGSGVSGTLAMPIAEGDGTTWTIGISAVSGDGSLGVDFTDATGVSDAQNNPVTNTLVGEQYNVDQTAPTVDAIVRTDTNPTSATTLTFRVTFSEAVTGVTPDAFAISGAGVTATIDAPSTTDGVTWTVQLTSVSGSGTIGLDLVNGAAVADAAGNPLSSTLSGEQYNVDQTAPTVDAIVRADTNPTSATSVRFTVTFSEAVTDFTEANLAVGGAGVVATIGTPTTSDGITWSVELSNLSGSGTLGLNLVDGTGVVDVVGNALANTLAGEQYDVDRTAPTAVSLVRTDTDPTSATVFAFLLTFSERVSGVTSASLALSGSGVTGTLAEPVAEGDGTTWTISVSAVIGDGTFGVDFVDASGVADSMNNPVTNTLVGEQYAVDQTAPTVEAIVRADTNPTSATTLTFIVTFSEAVSGLADTNFALSGAGVTATIGAPATADGIVWTVELLGVSGNGTIGLDVSNGTGVVDVVGNVLANTMAGEQYNIDQNAPTVDMIIRADASPTSATTLRFTITFSEAVTSFTEANLALSSAGVTATIGAPATADGVTWSVELTAVSGSGTLGLDLVNAAGVVDAVGNPLANTLAGEQYDVDRTAPTAVSLVRTDTNPTSATVFAFLLTFSERVSGVTSASLALSGSGVSGTLTEPVAEGDGTTWTITVSTVSGDGTLGVDFVDAAGVSDAQNNPVANTLAGEQYNVDQTAPAVDAIVRTDTSPTSATSLTFRVTFSEAVSGVTADAFALSGAGVTATIGAPGTTDGVTWTVQLTGVSGSGTIGLDLVNGAAIVDSAGNSLSNTLAGEQYNIDQNAPTVDMIIRADASPTSATTLRFTITFSEAVTSFTEANLALSSAGVTATIGAPATADGVTWSVELTAVSGSGTLGLDVVNGTGVVDAVGNALANTLAGEQYDVDQTAPTAVSLVRTDINPTSATVLGFLLTFSEPVSGVTSASLALSGSGVTGTLAEPVAEGDGTTWTITVSTVSGDGTLGVDFVDATGVSDAQNNPVTNTLAGEQYNIDQTAPAVDAIVRTGTNPTSATTVRYTVTFSEAVTGFTEANLTLSGVGVTATIGAPATADGVTWNVELTTVSGSGTLGLDLVDGAGIADASFNPLANTLAGEQYNVDQTAPTVDSIVRADANPTSATTVRFTVTFSEAVTSFTEANLALSSAAVTATIGAPATADGVTWSVELTAVSGSGTLGLDLVNAAGVVDAVGNPLANTLAGEQYDVDQTAPTAISLVRTDTNPTSATVLAFLLTFSEPVSGVTSASLTLSGSGVTGTLIEPVAEGDGTTWTITVSAVAGDGTLGVDFVDAAGVSDAQNNPVTNTLVGEQYNVDQTAPTVGAIVRTDTNPTSATTLTLNVTFSEAVSGLADTNFALSGTGVTATVGAPGTTDGITWSVQLTGVSGTGTIGLDLVNGTGVVDAVGNILANTLAGEQYNVDQTAPTVDSIVRTDTNPTSATTVRFTITFSEAVTGFTEANLALSGAGVTAIIGAPATADGITWSVELTSVSGSGTLGLDVVNGTGVVDAVGNPLANTLAGEQYDVDQTAPTAVSLVRTDTNPTSATVLGFLLTFSEPVSGVTSASLALSGSGVTGMLAEPVAEGDGTTWTIAISAVTGDGALGVDFVDAAGVSDAQNNLVTNTLAGEQYNVDQTAPAVDAIVRTDTNPTSATTVRYTVTFSEAVTGFTEANVTLSGTGVTATIGAPATADGVTWNVELTTVSGSGTLGLDLVDGAGIADASFNPLANTLAGEQYNIDQTAPTVDSIVRADANPTSATTVRFTVTFSEAVTSFTEANLALSSAGVTATIGAPATADGVTWSVELTAVSGSGTLGLDLVNAAGVVDAVGNPLANTLAGEQYDVDQTAPTAISLVRADTNPTSATVLGFLLTFSEPVSGVTSASLALSGSGVTGTLIEPVAEGDGTTWTITVSAVAGDGTLGVDFVDAAGVSDAQYNPVTNTFAGEQYNVDQTAPTVDAIVRADANPTSATTLTFNVTFSEAVSGVTADAFALSGAGVTATVGAPGTTDGITWSVQLTGVSGTGTLGLDLANGTGVVDAIGNILANTLAGEQYNVDQTAPTVDSIVRTDTNPTSATTVRFTVTFSEAVTSFTEASLTLSGAGVTATIGAPTTADGITWSVELTSVSGSGTLGLDLVDGIGVVDAVGNPLANILAGEQYDVDQTAPTAISLVRTDTNPTSATVLLFLLTFSEPVSGVTSASLTLSGSGVTGTLAEPVAEGDGTTWTITVSTVSGDGTLGVDFVDAAGVSDAQNNPVTNTLAGEQYNVDQTAPTINAITRVDANPTNASAVKFAVLFSETVAGPTEANFAVSGAGVSAIINAPVTTDGTSWTVQLTGVSGTGTLGLDLLDGTGITDAAGNPLANTFAGEKYDVDQAAPVAVSLVRTDVNPTSATTVGFFLTFNEPVFGVSSSNFTLSGAGVTGTIEEPTPDDGTHWFIEVTGVTGDGTLGIDLISTAGIQDATGNALQNTVVGEVYDVDQTWPMVTSITRTDTNPTSATAVGFRLLFTEAVDGVTSANFALSGSGVTGIVGEPLSADGGITWDLLVSSVAGNGTLGIDLVTTSGVHDLAFNPLANVATGEVYNVQQTAPLVLSIVRTDTNPTSATVLRFAVTFSTAVSGFNASSLALSGTGVTGVIEDPTTSDGITWGVSVSSVSGSGTLGIDLVDPTGIYDSAGNELASPATGEVYDVDQTAPVVQTFTLTDANPTTATTVSFSVTFSEAVTGLLATNFNLSGSGVSGTIDAPVTTDGITWTITVSGLSGSGTIGIDLTSGSGVVDAVGNPLAGTPYAGPQYTICPVLDQVTMPVPANMETTHSQMTTLSWAALPTATSYYVFLDDVLIANATNASATVSGPLSGGLHTWRVDVTDGCTVTTGTGWTFNILDAADDPQPADGSRFCASQQRLEWSVATGATSYDVSINGSTVGNTTGTLWEISPPLPQGTHTWSVIARNDYGFAVGPEWTFELLPGGAVDPQLWRAQGQVHAIVVDGNTLYLGGSFQSLRSPDGSQQVQRSNVAAINLSTGQPTSWNPSANNMVTSLASSGGLMYVGGQFTMIGGASRLRVAAIYTSNGQASPWNPSPNGLVRAIATDGNAVYIGGDFTAVGTTPRSRLAHINALGGAIAAWNPAPTGPVYSLVMDANRVYVGGIFQNIGGQQMRGVASVDRVSGLAQPWAGGGANLYVYSLALRGTTLYCGGSFSTMGGQARRNLAAIDLNSGAVTGWNPDATNTVSALAALQGTIYVGGYFSHIGGQAHPYMAAVSAITGAPETCTYQPNNIVRSLAVGNNVLYAGGDFTFMGSTGVMGFAGFGTTPVVTSVEDWAKY